MGQNRRLLWNSAFDKSDYPAVVIQQHGVKEVQQSG